MSPRLRRMLAFGGMAPNGRTSFLKVAKQSILRLDTFIQLILGIFILFLLFGTPLFSMAVGVGAGIFFLLF